MHVTVRYYAAARELTGLEEERLELPGDRSDIAALRSALADHHPRLVGYLERMRLAINGDFAKDGAAIGDGDEVVVMPPVAGGAPEPLVDVWDQPLSVDECMGYVTHPSVGGVCVFVGVVRDHADGKDVARLDYEAYTDLAIKEMRRILATLMAETPGLRLAALHRVGQLAVGDLAVVVAAGAPHRAEAFAGCRAAIDRIKETVPVWKKEWDPDGNANWVNLESQ